MSKRQFEEEMAIQTFKEILKAVMFLHSKKLIHRDIKPENVLLDESGRIKLCDFGFCAPFEAERRVTFCGTQQYLPPEIMNAEDQSDKVDIWCMGVLLFELMHKRVPFDNKNMKIYMEQIAQKKVAFNSRCSWPIRKLISSCLEMNPKDRPSAAQLLSDPLLNSPKSNNRANSLLPTERTNRGGIKMMGNWIEPRKITPPKNTTGDIKVPIFNNVKRDSDSKEKLTQTLDNRDKNRRGGSPIIPSLNARDTRFQNRAQTPNINTTHTYFVNRMPSGVESTPVSSNPSFKSIPTESGYKQVSSSIAFGERGTLGHVLPNPHDSTYLLNYQDFVQNNHMVSMQPDSMYRHVNSTGDISEIAMNNVKMSVSTNNTYQQHYPSERQDHQSNFNNKGQPIPMFKDFNSLFTKDGETIRMPKNPDAKRALTPKPDYQLPAKQSFQPYSPSNAPSNSFFPSPVKQTTNSGIVINHRVQRSPSPTPTHSGNYSSVQSQTSNQNPNSAPNMYIHQPYTPNYKNSPNRNINILPIVENSKKETSGMNFYYHPVSLTGEQRSQVLYKQSYDGTTNPQISHSPNKKSN